PAAGRFQEQYHSILNALYCFGSGLSCPSGIVDDNFIFPITDYPEENNFDEELHLRPTAPYLRIPAEKVALNFDYQSLGSKGSIRCDSQEMMEWMGIPAKLNAYSEGKPNGVPG